MGRKQDLAVATFSAVFGGAPAPTSREGWHVETEAYGRVRVATRSNAVRHTNWYAVTNLDRRCQYLLLVEFDGAERIVGAWLLDQRDIERFGRTSNGRTKFAMYGHWRTAERAVTLE